MRCDALNPKAVGPAQAPALAQFGVGGHKGFGDATAEHRADKGEKAEDEHEGIQLAGGAELVGDEGVLGEGDDLADHREQCHQQEARDHSRPRPACEQGTKGGWQGEADCRHSSKL